MTFSKLTSRQTIATLMLSIGLLQIAAYYLAGMLASPDGSMAVPQPDTLLYCQAARRIAEGYPFSFSNGSAVCTGTTSVLYPFILSVPYLLGAKGDALLTAGFALNAIFYLVFLLGWAKAVQSWLERPVARLVATLLIALSGQIAFCAMAQSDIGCWLAASGWLAAGLAMRNRWLYGSLLILGPWIRPEGMVCTIAFGIFVLLGMIKRNNSRTESVQFANHGDCAVLVFAILSTLGVFALNFALTGQFQFASVANKGYFKAYPFATAVDQLAGDGIKMLKDYLFGVAASPRDLLMIPFLAAVFIWVGIFCHPWRNSSSKGLALLALAVGGGFLTVAQSGWQGTNFDRYLAWTAPVFLLFLAEGLDIATERLKTNGMIAWLPAAICLIFSFGAAFVSICRFSRSSSSTDHLRLFAHEVDRALPPTSSIGAFGGSGIAYELGHRSYKHLWGIYSPEFLVKTEAAALEILKNHPERRFDYWFLTPDQTAAAFDDHINDCCDENILTGPDGIEIRKARWDVFEMARQPQATVPSEKKLVAKVDIGYESDEKNADYEIIDRYGRPPADPYTIVAKLNGQTIIDAARLLVGGDSMTIPLQVGKDTTVVMRTYPKRKESRRDAKGQNSSDYGFANPLRMNIAIDGQMIQQASITYATNGFSDISFTLPGSAIHRTPCRIAFLGDHIAAGYWFYQ